MSKKLTFKFVKQYFEDRDCELFETEYINNSTLMRYECDCGNPDCRISFSNFKKEQRCIKCGGREKLTFEFVYNYFKDNDCELFETEYINCDTPMRYRCDCGNKKCKIIFYNFKKGQRCMECSGSKKLTFEDVKQYFEDHDCELFETEYINNRTKMRYRCDCGNKKCKISFSNFKKGHRCMKCSIKKRSGKNHPNYNPNLTDKEREKGRIYPGLGKWKKDVRKKYNYTCQYCGEKEGKLCAHHIEDYGNNKELRIVLSNGITFCEEHHIEFHKKYGNNCNREQLNEFLFFAEKINMIV